MIAIDDSSFAGSTSDVVAAWAVGTLNGNSACTPAASIASNSHEGGLTGSDGNGEASIGGVSNIVGIHVHAFV